MMASAFALAAGLATQAAAQDQVAAPTGTAGTAAGTTEAGNVITVSGARYGFQPVDVKRDSAVIVDSVTYDDLEAPTGDSSVAAMVLQVPGVSFEGDGDEPRYITIRGLSADLNATTIDGLTLATLGENGSGTRRVNLQLVPADISQRVDVYKAFTAEQDAAAIGGLTNIVTRSAFDMDTPYYLLDAYGIYSTFKGPAGENSAESEGGRFGYGVKAAMADRFGADGQFGVVFTGRYQQRARNSNKNWTDRRTYFDAAGKVIPGPDAALGWDGKDGTTKFAFGDYSNTITNAGGSLKLEWQAAPAVATYLMGYIYNRREASTMNSSDMIGRTTGLTDRTERTGTVPVDYVQSVVRSNQWDRTAMGLIYGFDWEASDISRLSIRAGYTRETYQDDEHWARVRTRPGNVLSYGYSMEEVPQLTGVTGDPFANNYQLNGSNINYNEAWEDVIDLRADYSWNVDPFAEGFGFVAGARYTRLDLEKDVDSIRQRTGGDANGYMYDPGYSYHGSNGLVLPWINYDRYWANTPAEDVAASAHYSRIADYGYEEEVANAYLSLHYRLPTTHIIAGLRYDDVTFSGTAPLTVDGQLTDRLANPSGGYDNWLPSLNITQDLARGLKLRGSVSRTIGRPTPGNIVQAEAEICGEAVTGCVITRGNPDLKPRRADNYDLALEYYFPDNEALVALTSFHKKIRDDIFTLTTEYEEDGLLNQIRQPMNAEASKVSGLEFAFVDPSFGFAPDLGASLNVSRQWGSMTYASDTVSRDIDRVLQQPDWMANLALTWRVPQVDGAVRLTANYQDDFLTSVANQEWDDFYVKGRTSLDLSAWHRVGRDLTFKYEVDNVLGAPPEWYHRRNVNGTLSQRDHYGRGFYFHIVYTPRR